MIGSSEDTKSFCALGGPASIIIKLIGSSEDTKSFCAMGGPASKRNKLIGSFEDIEILLKYFKGCNLQLTITYKLSLDEPLKDLTVVRAA